MNRQFLSAAVLACTLSHVRDPETENIGWLIKCKDGAKQEYTSPNFIKRLPKAKSVAKQWLAHRPRQMTVDAKKLGYK